MDTEQTLAEMVGLRFEDARAIAQVACDKAESGDLEGGREILELLVELNPKDSAMQFALGTIYQKLGMKDLAERCYSAAIERSNHAFALVNRGELRVRRGDAGGREDLAKVLALDPKLQSIPGQRARVLLQVFGQSAGKQAQPARPTAKSLPGKR